MAVSQYLELFSSVGANGNYPANGVDAGGSSVFANVSGTFNGASVSFQYLPLGHSTWIDIPSSTLTAAGSVLLRCGVGDKIRGVVSGAAAGTNLIGTLTPYLGGV